MTKQFNFTFIPIVGEKLGTRVVGVMKCVRPEHFDWVAEQSDVLRRELNPYKSVKYLALWGGIETPQFPAYRGVGFIPEEFEFMARLNGSCQCDYLFRGDCLLHPTTQSRGMQLLVSGEGYHQHIGCWIVSDRE